MIPKVIHYCWFGKKKKSKLIKDCIKSWSVYLPDYTIVEWNEINCDLSDPFLVNAYSKKKWAFVSDYIRLKVLYDYGGIYLDTDMLVLKSLDDLLEENIFFGCEDFNYINCAIIGSVAKNEFINKCIDFYSKVNNFDFTFDTIPRIVTQIFKREYDFNNDFDSIITKDNIKIFPFEYFYPLPFDRKKDISNYKNYLTGHSYAVHLWSSSWIEFSEFQYFTNKQYALGFTKMVKVIIEEKKLNLKYLKKIASSIKQSRKNNF